MSWLRARHLGIGGIGGIWAVLAALTAFGTPFCAAAQDITAEVTTQGEFIMVRASVDLPASRATAWSVLTDYDSLAQFIPDMEYSRVVSRGPDGLVVAQKGRYGVLFFARDVEVQLAVIESPPHTVVSRFLSGNVRDMNGRYDLSENASGTRLVYQGRLLPTEDLPPLIGLAMVRYALERHFTAMVREIERRDALERGRTGQRAAQ